MKSFKYWSEKIIYLIVFFHLMNLVRYENRSGLTIPDTWISNNTNATCNTEVSSSWLNTLLYTRCYPQEFKGRITEMRGQDAQK